MELVGWVLLFQFQNGAIDRQKLKTNIETLNRFNSKMVRLIVLTSLSAAYFYRVSIPKWCD